MLSIALATALLAFPQTEVRATDTLEFPDAMRPAFDRYQQCLNDGLTTRSSAKKKVNYDTVGAAVIAACKTVRASAFAEAQTALDPDPVPSSDRHAGFITSIFDALEVSFAKFVRTVRDADAGTPAAPEPETRTTITSSSQIAFPTAMAPAIETYKNCLGERFNAMSPLKAEDVATLDAVVIAACKPVRAQAFADAERLIGTGISPLAERTRRINLALEQLDDSFRTFVNQFKAQVTKTPAAPTK